MILTRRGKKATSYYARAYQNGVAIHLGSFETRERAEAAIKIFRHWVSVGFTSGKIPTAPKTKDAI